MSKKQTFKCDWRGRDFKEHPDRRPHEAKYCSRACYNEYRSTHEKLGKKRKIAVLKCDHCGIEFERFASRIRGKKNYCSIECRIKGSICPSSHSIYTCGNCGKEFEKRICRVRSENVYCSRECFYESRRGKDWEKNTGLWNQHYVSIPKDLRSCYLKEARAMLEGKDTYGKNKCVELPEESSQTMKIVIAREENCVAVN